MNKNYRKVVLRKALSACSSCLFMQCSELFWQHPQNSETLLMHGNQCNLNIWHICGQDDPFPNLIFLFNGKKAITCERTSIAIGTYSLRSQK